MKCIKPDICIMAPRQIADHILSPRSWVLNAHVPHLDFHLNPPDTQSQTPTIFLDERDRSDVGLISRKISDLATRTYRDIRSGDILELPDMVAGLDRNFEIVEDRDPKNHDLWLSIDIQALHNPGIRQAMDWVESCIISLSWLNRDPIVR